MKTGRSFIFFAIIFLLFSLSCHENDIVEEIKKPELPIELPQTGLPDNRQILVGGNGFVLPIKINGSWKAEMKECDWCSIKTDENDTALLKISIDKNDTPEERSVFFSITINNGWWPTKTEYQLTQGVAGSVQSGWVEITTSNEGQLVSKLKDLPAGMSGIVRLKISGPVSDDDCRVIRYAKTFMPKLTYLDMENMAITKLPDETFSDNESITELTLPKTLTSIGKSFYFDEQSQNKILQINVPENSKLTRIDDNAFRNCTNLMRFNIPVNITYIGSYAFYNCQRLNSPIVLPPDAENINPYTFCNSAMYFPENFRFPATIKEIEERAFYSLNNYYSQGINFPTSLTYIGEAAFSSSRVIVNGLPNNLREIADSAFYGCGVGGSLVIPSSVKKIGNHAFQNCSMGNWNIIINEGLESIGDFAFANNYGLIGDVTIPGSVMTIGAYCFAGCEYLDGKLILSDGLKEIKNGAFYSSQLKSLSLPHTLTAIGDSVFANCGNLTGKLAIPSSLALIGNYAFFNCNRLTDLDMSQANHLDKIGISAFESCTGFRGNLILPVQITAIAKSAFKKTGFDGSLILPDNMTVIEQEVFMQSAFKKVVLPSNLLQINDNAFYYCENLKECQLPSSIRFIRNGVFQECFSLSGNLVLPGSLESLGDYAFNSCWSFTGNFTFPPKLTSIGKWAFESCRFTGNLSIPDAVTDMGMGAFSRCFEFNGKLTIGKGLKQINDYMFDNCNFVGELTIPDNIESIGKGAFSYSKYASLILGKGLKSVGYAAFYSNNLQTVKCYAIVPPATTYYNFHSISFNLFVPLESIDLYRVADGWKEARSINPL